MTDSNQFKIEKGVPIPPVHNGGVPPNKRVVRKYPFASMERGDSVLIAGAGDAVQAKNVWQSISMYKKRDGLAGEFTTRRVDGGVRVWRIE